MKSTLFKISLSVWILLVVINYLIHHPAYFYAIIDGSYLKFLFGYSVLSAGAIFLFKNRKISLNGWKVYLLILFTELLLFQVYSNEIGLIEKSSAASVGIFIFKNILLQLGALLIFLFSFASGASLMSSFRENLSTSQFGIVSLSLGIGLVSLVLFSLGSFGIYYNWLMFPIMLIVLVFKRKAVLEQFKNIFLTPLATEGTSIVNWILSALLVVFVAYNLIGAHKIFPIGFDGASLYQNLSNLIFNSNELIAGGQAYGWPLFTSLGAVLFGKMSFSIFITHIVVIPCLWGVYELSRLVMSEKASLFVTTVFYSLPATGFLAFHDEKVDLGFLLIILAVLIFIIQYGKEVKFDFSISDTKSFKFFALIGLLLGFAMGIKYTAILAIVSLINLIVFSWGGYRSLIVSSGFSLSFLFLFNIHKFGYLEISSSEKWMVVLLGIVVSGVTLTLSFRKINWSSFPKLAKNLAILLCAAIIGFGPWMMKNIIETKSLSPKSILYGEDESNTFKYKYTWLFENDIDFKLKPEHRESMIVAMQQSANQANLNDQQLFQMWIDASGENKQTAKLQKPEKNFSSGKREEILRYLGYEDGLSKYISLPFDLTFNTNIINKRGVDISFLFLLILVLFFFDLRTSHVKKWRNPLVAFSLLLGFYLSWKSVLVNKGSFDMTAYLNAFSNGRFEGHKDLIDQVFNPFLVLQTSLAELMSPLYSLCEKINFPFSVLCLGGLLTLFALLSKSNWSKLPRTMKVLLSFMISFGFLFLILGNGIVHYGITLWVGLLLLIFYYLSNLEEFLDSSILNFTKKSLFSLVALVLVLNTTLMFTNKDNKWDSTNDLFSGPILLSESTIGKEEEILKQYIPELTAVKKVLNEDDTKIYQIGTFFEYHVENNHLRIFKDNQLTSFDRVSQVLNADDEYIEVLKGNGVQYILFDLKVASIDNTPNKTLTKKANRFVKVLNNREKVKLLLTDNLVSRTDPQTGKSREVYGLSGKTIKVGSFAVFKLL